MLRPRSEAQRPKIKVANGGYKKRLLDVTDGAYEGSSELISEVPGRLQTTIFLRDTLGLAGMSVTTSSRKEASFQSRPFGLADSDTLC